MFAEIHGSKENRLKILVTGTAGFIGYHLAESLCAAGNEIVGFDNLCDYYDTGLKYARLAQSGFQKKNISSGKVWKNS